jgi:hypothetical protein
MNSYRYVLSVIRASVFVVAALAAAVSGAADERTQAQAQLLDHAEFFCANCFFGASDYYYCFAADNQVLIGYQRTPVLNWQDKSKNYLADARPRWAAWTAPGETVPIGYDDKHIWLSRPEGKQATQGFWAQMKAIAIWGTRGKSQGVRLTRSSMRDIFTNGRCRAADRAEAH